MRCTRQIVFTMIVMLVAMESYGQTANSNIGLKMEALEKHCRACHSFHHNLEINRKWLDASFIEKLIKSKRKESTVMGRIAKGLSDEDIKNIAIHISSWQTN